MNSSNKRISFGEFVTLMAFVTCLVALATDLMLPALANIGSDLKTNNPKTVQLIITMLFFGVAIGQILYGPLSDAVGRKPTIYLGFSIFIIGTLISLFANNMTYMLIGRILQGFGAASPRIITIAIVRDRYQGAKMARVLSLIMAIFIIVPVIAPILGQAIMLLAGWRYIFLFLLIISIAILSWFAIRLPETHPKEKRQTLSPPRLLADTKQVIKNKTSLIYILALGLIFGAFLSFLSTVQPILQELYKLGTSFPFYFALLAIGVGGSSFLNSRLVMRFGMAPLVMAAELGIMLLSLIVLVLIPWVGSIPPLWITMIYLILILLNVGLLFGNLNALAMEPFSKIAGLASSVVSVISTLIAVICGILLGRAFNNTLLPLVLGFFIMSALAFSLTYLARRQTNYKG